VLVTGWLNNKLCTGCLNTYVYFACISADYYTRVPTVYCPIVPVARYLSALQLSFYVCACRMTAWYAYVPAALLKLTCKQAVRLPTTALCSRTGFLS